LPKRRQPTPLGFKRCSRCGATKPVAEFHRDRSRKDGLQNYCRDCNSEVAKAYHATHSQHCRDRIRGRSKRLKDENRRRIVEYLLEHPCVDCGEDDPVVLEFDHLRDKKLNVSTLVNLVTDWTGILAEIAKCEVVCANCHRRRTCVRVDSFRVRMMRELGGGRTGPGYAAPGV